MDTNNIDSINKQSRAIKEYDENKIAEDNEKISIGNNEDIEKIINETKGKEEQLDKAMAVPEVNAEEPKLKKKEKKGWINIAINYFLFFLKYYGFSIIILITLFIISKIFKENTIINFMLFIIGAISII